MKLKRYISLLFLAVYLLATAGVAVSSMSCACVAMRGHEMHVCCHHCEDHVALDGVQAQMHAPCCTNNHSNEKELYTATQSDNGKVVKCPISELPSAILSLAVTVEIDSRTSGEEIAERHVSLSDEWWRRAVGLRAPPVLA